MTTIVQIILAVLSVLAEPPKDFPIQFAAESSFQEMLTATEAEKFLVIVSFEKSPRQVEIWSDPRIKAWVSTNAIAIGLSHDVFGMPSRPATYVSNMLPGITVLRGRKTLDEGPLPSSSDELLAYLEQMSTKGMDVEFAHRAAGTERSDILPRIYYGRRLDSLGETALADAEYLWAFEEVTRRLEKSAEATKDPDTRSARDCRELIGRAREAFARVADPPASLLQLNRELIAKLESKPEEATESVFSVARVVGQYEHIFAWMDKGAHEALRGSGRVRKLRQGLISDMFEDGRWDLAGALIKDPIADASELFAVHAFLSNGETEGETVPPWLVNARDNLRFKIACYYAALLANGREVEASRIAWLAWNEFPDQVTFRYLLLVALEAGEPREEQLEWARIADATPAKVRKMLPLLRAALHGKLR